MRLEGLQNLPDLIKSSWNMEATLPFSALEREKDFTTAIKVAVPFRILRVLEMSPHIIVELFKPLKAFLVSCELVALDHADRRFKMYPP